MRRPRGPAPSSSSDGHARNVPRAGAPFDPRPRQAKAGIEPASLRPHRSPAPPRTARQARPWRHPLTARITLDALNAATALTPCASPSASTLSFVTIAASVMPPSSVSSTSLFTAPRVTVSTTPCN